MTPPRTERQLRALLARLCDGTASPEEVSWLAASLLREGREQTCYLEFMAEEAALAARGLADADPPSAARLVDLDQVFQQADRPATMPETSTGGAAIERAAPVERAGRARRFRQAAWQRVNRITPVSMIVSFLFLTNLLLVLAMWPVPAWQPPPQSPDSRSRAYAARVVRSLDAVWSNPSGPIAGPVRDLAIGEPIHLDQGWAEIRFYSGAVVLVRAPAALCAQGENRLELETGSLTARVPGPAVGFVVELPEISVVDLGTEFGIDEQASQTDVYVYEGSVQVASNGESFQPLRLEANEGIRLHRAGGSESLSAPPDQLIRRMPTPSLQPVTEAEDYTRLVLSLEPVAFWNFEREGEHSAMVRDASGNGHHGLLRGEAETVAGGRFGRGVRLDGKSGFVEIADHPDLNPGLDSFTLAGWIRVDGRDGEHHLLGKGHDERYSAQAIWSLRLDRHGAVRAGLHSENNTWNLFDSAPSGDLRDGRWHHLAAVFDRRQNYLSHYLNGRLIHTVQLRGREADTALMTNSHTLKIGMNDGFGFTRGMIDEVAYFRTALSSEQIAQLAKPTRRVPVPSGDDP